MISIYDDIVIESSSADYDNGNKTIVLGVSRRYQTSALLLDVLKAMDRGAKPKSTNLDDYCVIADLGYRWEEMTVDSEWADCVKEWDANRERRQKHQWTQIFERYTKPREGETPESTAKQYCQVLFELSKNSKVCETIDADNIVSNSIVEFLEKYDDEDLLLRMMFAAWSLNHSGRVRITLTVSTLLSLRFSVSPFPSQLSLSLFFKQSTPPTLCR
jgi:hypothetical protein